MPIFGEIEVNTSGKLCSICGYENAHTAVTCQNCGAVLEENPTNIVAIPEVGGGLAIAPLEHLSAFMDVDLIPEDGVGIHIAGALKPFYLHIYKELLIGREPDATLEAVLDLSELDAFNMGVSRRHAKLRRTDFGFEVIDLGSRNGTWLNAERLIANKPYPLASGSQLRIGQMRLLIAYREIPKSQGNS